MPNITTVVVHEGVFEDGHYTVRFKRLLRKDAMRISPLMKNAKNANGEDMVVESVSALVEVMSEFLEKYVVGFESPDIFLDGAPINLGHVIEQNMFLPILTDVCMGLVTSSYGVTKEDEKNSPRLPSNSLKDSM